MEKANVNQSQLAAFVVTDFEFLRRVSKKTSRREIEKKEVVALIKYCLLKAWIAGYGLAAVQVGMPIAAAWYWLPSDKDSHRYASGEGHLLVNPEIKEYKNLIVIPGEGCLSIPKKMFTTRRYNNITYLNDGLECKAEGIEAQIIQHEVDHINGILVPDRVYHPNEVGRNDPCPCGSGKKYKKCCIDKI